MRRLVPTAVALAAVLVSILAGLAALQGVFRSERDDAIASSREHRRALGDYAAATLRERLRAGMDTARDRAATATDPRANADGLYLRRPDQLVFPRTATFSPDAEDVAVQLHAALLEGHEASAIDEDDGPWVDRHAKIEGFFTALDRQDVPAIETSFRDVLRHRSLHRLAPARDLASMVALVDRFRERGDPAPELLRGLLADGIDVGRGERIEPLQVELLRSRGSLSARDFAFLGEQILMLSRATGVPHADFADRLIAAPEQPPNVPETLPGPTLIDGYYLVPEVDGTVVGYRPNLEELLAGVTEDMLQRGLVGAGDRLSLMSTRPRGLPAGDLVVDVESPRWAREAETIAELYALKGALALLCGALALAMTGLALLAQYRKLRFVALKSDFVAAVSHELRTPLASMRLMAETLQRKLAGDPRAKDYPDRILRDLDGLGVLVENVLSFDRLEKGRIDPAVEDIRLADELSALRGDMAMWSHRPARLEWDVPNEATVRADRDLLRLCLLNLIRNGCLYNERDPAIIQVSLTVDDRTRIQVRDNGTGIDREEWEAVFGEFYRGRSRTTGSRGSGLGLAICRRIVRSHGGEIRILDSSPEGTTFELAFPS